MKRNGFLEKRTSQRPGAIESRCLHCGCSFWLPPSKHGKYVTCSSDCAQARRSKVVQAKAKKPTPVTKSCETCGKPFSPRPYQLRHGWGRFCSQACNTAVAAARDTPEARAKRTESIRRAVAEGRLKHKTGPDHPNWTGGEDAYASRCRKGGEHYERRLEYTRTLRKERPDLAREWSQTRHSRKTGRLPRGTVKATGDRQLWRCVYCSADITGKYHMDHVMPLALGGKHEPANIQLLCPTCNVRKSSRHPDVAKAILGKNSQP